jgi:hypothetical protein
MSPPATLGEHVWQPKNSLGFARRKKFSVDFKVNTQSTGITRFLYSKILHHNIAVHRQQVKKMILHYNRGGLMNPLQA